MRQKENSSLSLYRDQLKFKNPKELNIASYTIPYYITGFVLLIVANTLSPSLHMMILSGLSAATVMSFGAMMYRQYQENWQNKLKKLNKLIEGYEFSEIEILLKNNNISLAHKSQFEIDIKNANYWRMAKILFLSGVNVDFKDRNGRTPLMHLILKKEIRSINEILKEHKPNLKTQDNDKNTALIYAIISHRTSDNDKSIVKMLLSSPDVSQYVNMADDLGFDALMKAVSNKEFSQSLIKILLECGANINARNNDGENAIAIATRIGNYQAANFLNKYLESKNFDNSPNQDVNISNSQNRFLKNEENYNATLTNLSSKSDDTENQKVNGKDSPVLNQLFVKKYDNNPISLTKEERNKYFMETLEKQQKQEEEYQIEALEKQEEDKLNKLKANWLLDKKESLLELKGLIKSIIEFLPKKIDLHSDIDKISFKGSSLYKYYLSDDRQNLRPHDIDLELISTKLLNHQNSQDLQTSICQLFSIKDDNYLRGFKVWRGERGSDEDITKEIWNIEFILDEKQTGLNLPVNIVIRNKQHINPPEKDWVISFDALRMTLYEKDLIKIGECPKISVCPGPMVNIKDLVEQLRDGKFSLNNNNYNLKKIKHYTESNVIKVLDFTLNSSSNSLSNRPSNSPCNPERNNQITKQQTNIF